MSKKSAPKTGAAVAEKPANEAQIETASPAPEVEVKEDLKPEEDAPAPEEEAKEAPAPEAKAEKPNSYENILARINAAIGK